MASVNQMRSLILHLGILPEFPLPPDCLPFDECLDAFEPLLAMKVIDWDGHGYVLTDFSTSLYQRFITGQAVPEIEGSSD
jgi:hypothetical protein